MSEEAVLILLSIREQKSERKIVKCKSCSRNANFGHYESRIIEYCSRHCPDGGHYVYIGESLHKRYLKQKKSG